jgi:hypothetical protein
MTKLFGSIITFPLILYNDNQSAISLAHAELGQFHTRTKHIDIRYHFIREKIENGTLEVSRSHLLSHYRDDCRHSHEGSCQIQVQAACSVLHFGLRGECWKSDHTKQAEEFFCRKKT